MARVKPVKSRVFVGERALSNYESYSSLSKWLKCPAGEFVSAYWDKTYEPSTLPLTFGNAWHGLCEDTLIDKMLGGTSFTTEKARERWHQRWIIEVGDAMDAHGLKVDERTPERWYEQGLKLTDIWMKDWLPKLSPRDVEIPFSIKFTDPKITREIFGRLDLTLTSSELMELKTSGRPFKNAREEYELQVAIYHVAHSTLYKEWPKRALIIRAETEHAASIEPFDVSLSRERVQEIFNDTVMPAMRDISIAWETGIFTCTCKNNKHGVVNFFEESKKRDELRAEQDAKNERILDPEKWRKDHLPEIIESAITAAKVAREINAIEPDAIPF